MNEDDEVPTQLYSGAAHGALANDEGPTRFDASADLKAVIAHAEDKRDPGTPATMILGQAYVDPPSAAAPPNQPPATAATPDYPGWGAGQAPAYLYQAPPAQTVEPAPKGFAKRLALSAFVTFLLGGIAIGVLALIFSLS